MGNCMNRSSTRRQAHEEEDDHGHEQLQQVKECNLGGDELKKDQHGNFKKNGLKVKIVLTKEELEWLMMELRDEGGEGRKLEDLLSEIERGRVGKVIKAYWKPSLESIFESPEGMELDR